MSFLYEVRAYTYEGAVYCPHCAEYDESDPNWGVVFEENFDEDMYGMCCGTCHHSLACIHHLDYPCPECDPND